VGEVLLQQLRDDLAAVTNAPLCDSTDSSDTTVDPESSITCTATVRSDGASTDCARPLNVMLFYHTNAGGNENPVWLFGNEADTFGPLDDVRDIQLAISSNGVYVFSQPVEPGIYDFEVPIAVEPPETEFGDEGEGEFEGFSGTINPRVGENFVSFTIPEDYSVGNFAFDAVCRVRRPNGRGKSCSKMAKNLGVFSDRREWGSGAMVYAVCS
jgi:hypothetical protein